MTEHKTTAQRIKEQAEEYYRQLKEEKAHQRAVLGELIEATIRTQADAIEALAEENRQLREQLNAQTAEDDRPVPG